MKTLLITGANGFIGQHLSRIAVQKLSQTYKVVLLVSRAPQYPIADFILHKNYTLTRQDFKNAGIPSIHAVIHLGAAMAYSADSANLIARNQDSIRTLKHLIEQLPSIPEKFLLASTIDVYTNPTGATEESPVSPRNEYAKAKLCAEAIVAEWSSSKGIVHQVLRIGHVFGAGEERFTKLIPNLIRAIKRHEIPELVTTGEELRAFIHVRDCSKLILAALNLNSPMGSINIASDIQRQVREVAKILMTIGGVKQQPKYNPKNKGIDVYPSTQKMKSLLGKEDEGFEVGLQEEYENFNLSINPG